MKKIQHFFIMACSFLSITTITSCDNEYDLSKDINTEISAGKNLTLPVGETVKIPLSRIIKESNDLTADVQTGIYQLNANGDFSSQIAKTDPFEIGGLAPKFVNLKKSLCEQNYLPYFQQIPGEYSLDIPLNTHATYDIQLTDTKLPKEVKGLYKAEFNGDGKKNANGHPGAKSTIKIFIPNIDNGTNGIKEIHLEEVHIKFPQIFTLQDEHQEKDLPHEIYRHDIVLNKENNYTALIDIYILNAEISEDNQSKYIYEKDGNTYFSLQEGDDITFDVESAKLTIIPSEIKHQDIHFDFEYEIAATNITSVNGKITPDVNVDEQLALNDIPDFIKDESSEFTPNDITFTLSMDNPLGLELATDVEITPYNNNGTASGAPVIITLEGNNAIKPKATTKYVISNVTKTVAADETFILCENLPSLLSPIPDFYKITTGELTADGVNSTGLELGKDYTLTGKYDVDIPFSFSNVTINYSDVVDGLLNDLEDVADLTDKIEVSCDIESTIPADLTATVKLLDASGHELNDIIVTGTAPNTINIKAATDDKPETTHITLTIEEKAGSTQLEKLEKLEYSIKATNPINKNVVLKSTQYVIVKNGIAKMPNGVTTEL